MTIKQNDFIEIEFTGRITDTGEIFDTNIEEDAKKTNLDIKDLKPFILSVGHQMLPEGFDKDLIGKEIGNNYKIELGPDDAFGKRNSSLVKMIPAKHFHEQKIVPERGMQLSLDGRLVRILSSSSGRTLVDFNNPLAGKKITYEYRINRLVNEEKEKINALQEFLFKKKFDYELKEDKIILKIERELEPLINIFSKKFEEILGKKLEAEIVEKNKDKKEDTHTHDHKSKE